MAIILKISVRFTLKELRCEFSSSFDIISGSEEGGILFLQIVVMFGMEKKNRMGIEENIRYQKYFINKKSIAIQQEEEGAERESFLAKF